jgi:hypothetical protein
MLLLSTDFGSCSPRGIAPSPRVVAILFSAALLGTGCGLTGATSRFTVELPIKATQPIALASIELEPRAAQLTNIGSYAWGKYSADDLANLEGSLRDTLKEASGTPEGGSHVHVVVRSYLVATSNTQGGVLSCVAWAYVDRDGRLLFHEQFYATGSAVMNKTLGGLKDEVHEAIVRRISETAVRLAAGSLENLPARADNTYDTFAEAEATVPKELTTIISSWGLVVGYHWTVSGQASYTKGQRENTIDWDARIQH